MFEKLFELLLQAGIVVGFALWMYCKFAKKSVKETIGDIKSILVGKKKEDLSAQNLIDDSAGFSKQAWRRE